MRKKHTMKLALVGLVSATALTLAACGGGGNNSAAPAKPTATQASAGSPAGKTGAAVAVSLGDTDTSHMFMHVSKASVAAGSVTFSVTNDGVKKHEFVVLATDMMAKKLPYSKADDEVAEEGQGVESPGEIGELMPGETKTLTLDLSAGHYVLVCNIAGHWRMGMYSDFQVS
ncbi:MAG: sulfocyanin-like copper-binding protein [Actinomycetota bacterium]